MSISASAVIASYYAWNTSTGTVVTGDKANHTLNTVVDGTKTSLAAGTAGANITDQGGGLYTISVGGTANTGTIGQIEGSSSTANVILIGIAWNNLPASGSMVETANTNKLAFDLVSAVNYLKVTTYGFLGTLLTGTAANIVAAFKAFFNVTTPVTPNIAGAIPTIQPTVSPEGYLGLVASGPSQGTVVTLYQTATENGHGFYSDGGSNSLLFNGSNWQLNTLFGITIYQGPSTFGPLGSYVNNSSVITISALPTDAVAARTQAAGTVAASPRTATTFAPAVTSGNLAAAGNMLLADNNGAVWDCPFTYSGTLITVTTPTLPSPGFVFDGAGKIPSGAAWSVPVASTQQEVLASRATVNVYPGVTTPSTNTPACVLLPAFQNSEYSGTFPVLDSSGNPVDLSGIALTMDFWLQSDTGNPPAKAISAATTGTPNASLSIGGTSNNMVTVTMNAAATATHGGFNWLLRATANTTPPYIYGSLIIRAATVI